MGYKSRRFFHLILCSGILAFGCGGSRSSDQAGSDSSAVNQAQKTEASFDLLADVAKPLPPDAAPPEQQVFRYLAAEPKSIDMGVALYGSGGSEFMFERLCTFGLDGKLLPGAAERWESSADGKIWTFYLNPKARWSDGKPVTAYDFEYAFKRFLHPDAGNVYAFLYYDIKGAKAHNQRKNLDPNSVGVKAVDEHTFVIETEAPCAFLPYITAYHTSSPVPRWQVEKYGKRWTEAGKCVTNSAFNLGKWVPGQYMTFVLNPYYNGPNRSYLRQIVRVFSAAVGAASASGGIGLLPYENNEIDVVDIAPVDIDRVQKDRHLSQELWTFDQFATVYLYFRTQKAPFNDLRVRQAFAHAIDKEAIVNTILRGKMIPAYTMLPLHFPGYMGDKYRHIQRYDPELARRLLAEAGYPNGQGFPVKEVWLADATPASPISQAAQAIQQMLLDNLGVRISIRNVEGGTYRTNQYEWNMPMSINGFTYDFPDPHSLLGIIWRSQPRGYTRHDWSNPEFDALIDQAAGELDHEKRMQLYQKAERILVSEVGAVFLWHPLVYQLRKPWVKGLKPDAWGHYPNYRNGTAYFDIYIGKEVLASKRPLVF